MSVVSCDAAEYMKQGRAGQGSLKKMTCERKSNHSNYKYAPRNVIDSIEEGAEVTIQWLLLRRWKWRTEKDRFFDALFLVLHVAVLLGFTGVLVEWGREAVDEGPEELWGTLEEAEEGEEEGAGSEGLPSANETILGPATTNPLRSSV